MVYVFTPYIMPQENGARTGVRFAAFYDAAKEHGLLVVPANEMIFSALEYSIDAMTAAHHTCDLKADDRIYLNCDLKQRGLGTASCGPGPLEQYKIRPGIYRMRLIFKAFKCGEDAAQLAWQLRNF